MILVSIATSWIVWVVPVNYPCWGLKRCQICSQPDRHADSLETLFWVWSKSTLLGTVPSSRRLWCQHRVGQVRIELNCRTLSVRDLLTEPDSEGKFQFNSCQFSYKQQDKCFWARTSKNMDHKNHMFLNISTGFILLMEGLGRKQWCLHEKFNNYRKKINSVNTGEK